MPWRVDVRYENELLDEYGPFYAERVAEETAIRESRRYACHAELREMGEIKKVYKRGRKISLKQYLTD